MARLSAEQQRFIQDGVVQTTSLFEEIQREHAGAALDLMPVFIEPPEARFSDGSRRPYRDWLEEWVSPLAEQGYIVLPRRISAAWQRYGDAYADLAHRRNEAAVKIRIRDDGYGWVSHLVPERWRDRREEFEERDRGQFARELNAVYWRMESSQVWKQFRSRLRTSTLWSGSLAGARAYFPAEFQEVITVVRRHVRRLRPPDGGRLPARGCVATQDALG